MNQAIGIFDSGLGGLTVFHALTELLPQERLIYLGDTARVPYGTKSAPTVTQYSIENTEFLLQRGVKAVVVACNTASAFAVASLHKKFDVPMIGVLEPGAAEASRRTKSRCVGVIGTAGTIGSGAYEAAIRDHCPGATVLTQACPLFVPLVEEGWLDRPETFSIAREYLRPLREGGADTVILGCTHYPMLHDVIQEVMGGEVCLVDSATVTAQALRVLLEQNDLLCRGDPRDRPESGANTRFAPTHEFWVTDSPERFARIGEIFLGQPLENVRKV